MDPWLTETWKGTGPAKPLKWVMETEIQIPQTQQRRKNSKSLKSHPGFTSRARYQFSTAKVTLARKLVQNIWAYTMHYSLQTTAWHISEKSDKNFRCM